MIKKNKGIKHDYKKVPAVILSGGRSSRMDKKDKAFLSISNKVLLDLSIERLNTQASQIAINTNSKSRKYDTYNLPILRDTIKGYLGPLAGVFTAMTWAYEMGYKKVATVAVDSPFFPENLIENLSLEMEKTNSDIVFAASSPYQKSERVLHPVFGLWKTYLLKDLKKELEKGVRKVTLWSDKHKTSSVFFFNETLDPFFNVNTPDDVAFLKRYFEDK